VCVVVYLVEDALLHAEGLCFRSADVARTGGGEDAQHRCAAALVHMYVCMYACCRCKMYPMSVHGISLLGWWQKSAGRMA